MDECQSYQMAYPWPVNDPVLQDALDIALDYLEFTGQAMPFIQTQWQCANAIMAAWNRGDRHRIKLANCAIAAIERGSFSLGLR